MSHPHTGRSIIDHCYYAAVVISDLHYTLVKLTDTGRETLSCNVHMCRFVANLFHHWQ